MTHCRLVIAHSQKKSYVDRSFKALMFMDGYHVLIRVSPMKDVMRFKKNENPRPRFFRTFRFYVMRGG